MTITETTGIAASGPAADQAAVALEARVERIRAAVDGCAWTSIGLGLAFTTVNVQQFGAAGAPVYSPGWWVAWLLDPIPSLLLIAILLTEQVTARWQVTLSGWVGATKWATFAATAGMNTWSAFAAGSGAEIFKHAVPPVMVLLGAQVAPVLRDGLTVAVAAAAAAAGPARSVAPSSPAVPASSSTAPAVSSYEESGSALTTAGGDPAGAGFEPVSPRQGGSPGPGVDPRVAELARRLAAGEELDGPTAGAAVGCSERNARRLLATARDLAGQDTPPALVAGEPEGRRPLHLIGGA